MFRKKMHMKKFFSPGRESGKKKKIKREKEGKDPSRVPQFIRINVPGRYDNRTEESNKKELQQGSL